MAKRREGAGERLTMCGFKGRFADLLARLGWTHEKAAESIGVDTSQVGRWIAVTQAPDLDALLLIREKTKRNVDWLLTGDGPEHLGASRPKAELAADFAVLLGNGVKTRLSGIIETFFRE